MKTLTLLRHAKSGWDDPALRDFDRTLNEKGQRAAATVGRQMKAMGLTFDHIVASPAVRVVETLDHAGRGYGAKLSPQWDRRLYLASNESLLDAVHSLPDTAASALIVGHNPGLEELVLALVPECDDNCLRDDVEVKFPTASLAVMTFAVGHWGEVAPAGATLTHFVRPRDLDPALGPDEEGS